MSGPGLLFSEMTPDASWADAFHDWYDTEHIPVRMGAPGFISAQRYRSDTDASYLAVYEMQSPAALLSPEYQQIKGMPSERTSWMLKHVSGFTRYTCAELMRQAKPGFEGFDAPLLYAVFFTVPAARLADFDAWYEQDHVPILMECPEWQAVRRFDVLSGEPGTFNRLALHYLGSKAALDSPERQHARETPWRARLAGESWFNGKYLLFHKHGVRQLAT